jgi:hypothetical protein
MQSVNAGPVQGAQQARSISPDLKSATDLHDTCGVGHRVKATGSVLALVIDEECIFAGLQGGDIVVSPHGFTNALRYGSKFSTH